MWPWVTSEQAPAQILQVARADCDFVESVVATYGGAPEQGQDEEPELANIHILDPVLVVGDEPGFEAVNVVFHAACGIGERTLSRSGIALFDLIYHDPAITGPLLEDLAASQPMRKRREGSATATVRVKYNPANIGSVHVWNPKRGVYQTLPCTEADADGLSKWQHERIQEWVRAEQRETQDERRELRCAFRAKLRSTASLGTAKRIQRAEARLLNSPKIHQIASEHLRLEYAEARHDGMAPIIPTVPLRERDTQIASMQQTIEQLKQKAEQGSQQLQGEAQELMLEDSCRKCSTTGVALDLRRHLATRPLESESQAEPLLTGFEAVLSGLDKRMATPAGLQPATSALGKPCSMQLSYGATGMVPSGSWGRGKGGHAEFSTRQENPSD